MATRPKTSMSALVAAQRILLDNCLNDPGVAQVLAGFGYGPAELKVGQELQQRLEAAQVAQAGEYGQQLAATQAVELTWAEARLTYADSLALARVAFRHNIDAQHALRLNGDRKSSLTGWLNDAKMFYGPLLAHPEWVQVMARYGRDAKTLTAERAQVDEVDRLKSVQEREKGEARAATEARDQLWDETVAWFADLREVVKVAFSRKPQTLEKLGMVVLNRPRAKKKS